MSSSSFNRRGYYEDVAFTLFNDQLIRIIYGNDYSFLHSPPKEKIQTSLSSELTFSSFEHFSNDLNPVFLDIPDRYQERLDELAGLSWDAWGLTRMVSGQKWHRAYSRHGLADGPSIFSRLLSFQDFLRLSENKSVYIKDPRMIFSFPAYIQAIHDSAFKILFIKRSPVELLRSMRKHYGNRLFTTHLIDDKAMCQITLI